MEGLGLKGGVTCKTPVSYASIQERTVNLHQNRTERVLLQYACREVSGRQGISCRALSVEQWAWTLISPRMGRDKGKSFSVPPTKSVCAVCVKRACDALCNRSWLVACLYILCFGLFLFSVALFRFSGAVNGGKGGYASRPVLGTRLT